MWNRPGRRKQTTSTDFMAQLEADPAFQEQQRLREAERVQEEKEFALAEAPVVDALRATGIAASSVYTLYETPDAYPRALPVLLEHLQRPYPERVLFGIGVALTHKSARAFWDELSSIYRTTNSEAVNDRLGAALSSCARRENYDDLLEFIADSGLGSSRVYFLRPIHRIGNRMEPGRGRAVIASVADDPILGVEAQRILQGKGRSD